MLEKKFNQKYHYTGVEADEAIAFWASKYVLKELDSPVEMHIMDAGLFVEMCEENFDMVVMDIFLDDEIPGEFQEIHFLEMLKDLINPDGILIYNCLAYKEEDKTKSMAFFQNKFKKVFPDSTYLDVGGNWMLFNRAV
jgi:spermidine synthase